ncbi:MAG: hypothetical protein AAF066_08035 [Pseudomonadota bacterium]
MLHLFNSMGHNVEPCVSNDPEHVRMHVCGPKVRSFAHIGDARPAVVYDIPSRVRCKQVPKLTNTRNISDANGKIIARSLTEHQITQRIQGPFWVRTRIEVLAKKRAKARASRGWAGADEQRNEFFGQEVEVEASDNESHWQVRT